MSQTPGSVTGVVPRYQNYFSHTCEIVGARINREKLIAKHFFAYGRDPLGTSLLCILVASGAMTATSQRQSSSCLFFAV